MDNQRGISLMSQIGLMLTLFAGLMGAQTATDLKPAAAETVTEAKPVVTDDKKPSDAFVIGPEDVLFIQVLHEAALSGQQDVRPDGFISLQLAGEIKAAGLTPHALAEQIRDKLMATIRDPEVNVQVLRINSRKYTIQGEVRRPGTYPFATPVTVLEALVSGLGFTDFANTKKIYVLRNGVRLPFNYKDVSRGKHMEQNVLIQNGDQIFVP